MRKNLRDILTEILKKENERYKLVEIGFIRNLDTETEHFAAHAIPHENVLTDSDIYCTWKLSILRDYYIQKKFSSFIQANIGQEAFQRMIYELLQSQLNYRLDHEPYTEIDKYLASPGKTLSYLLCEEFKLFYNTHFPRDLELVSTKELNLYCIEILKKTFPHSISELLLFLKQDNRACWEIVCSRLKILTENVTKTTFRSYRNDAIHDIWTETCFELKKAIQSNKLKQDIDAAGLIAYSAGIVKNKIREFFRKEKKEPYIFVENWEQNLSLNESTLFCHAFKEENVMKDFLDLKDININDDYEYRIALSSILNDHNHPRHAQLIEGLKDKVDILLAHYVKNQSYEEIAVEKYGMLPDKELKKKADKFRQDVSRVKIKLKERFKEMLLTDKP